MTVLAKWDHTDKTTRLKRTVIASFVSIVITGQVFGLGLFATHDYLLTLLFLDFYYRHPRFFCLIYAMAAFVLLFALTYVLLDKLPKWLIDNTDETHRKFPISFDKRGIVRTALAILIAWIPVLIVFWPGTTTTYDTIFQLAQFFSPAPSYYPYSGTSVDAEFTTSNPLLDTLLFGSFVWMGRMLGSDSLGVFFYCGAQAVATAFVLSASICYCQKLRVPWKIRAAFACIVAFLPIFPSFAYSMQKDSLFSIFMLLYVLFFLETYRTRGKALRSLRFVVLFTLIATLCMLTKTTGTYAIILSSASLVLFVRGRRLICVILLVIPMVICSHVIPNTIYPLLDVASSSGSGGSAAGSVMTGVQLQQSVSVAIEHPESMTADRVETLDKIVDYDAAIENYDPLNLDGVAQQRRDDVTEQDMEDYKALWWEVGFEHPLNYVRSYFRLCGPFIVPSYHIPLWLNVSQTGIESAERHYREIGGHFHFDAKNPDATQEIVFLMDEFYQHVLCPLPVISLLLTLGFWGGWIPLYSLLLAFFFRKTSIWAFAPAVLTMLLLLACPSIIGRYVIPSVFIAIPTLAWMLYAAYGSARNTAADIGRIAFAGKRFNDVNGQTRSAD